MKYIIEFEDVPSFAEDGIAYYQCKQAPWWFSGDTLIGKLTSEQDILSEIDKIDKKVEKAYQRGLDDAWECARELYLNGACKDLFGEYFNTFIKNHTAQEAIEKLKAHKHDYKIEVGDEVNWDGFCFVVTRIYQPLVDKKCNGIAKDGSVYMDVVCDRLTKTGRHFDINKILEEMRE